MGKIKKLGYGIFVFYVMIGTALYFVQEKLIFQPTSLAQDFRFDFDHPFEELFLEADDAAIINAIHFRSENPKGVILYFHGNAGDLSRWGQITSFFVKKRYDVLVMDYRTYGKSTGKLSEEALYRDAQMCYDYLLKTYAEKDIIVYGRSLGTGIASKMAAVNRPKQLILETPYYSLVSVARKRFPMFPVRRVMKYEIPSYRFLNDVACPLTIFHGTDDTIVPFESGKSLFDSHKGPDKTFVEIKNGRHNNLIEFTEYLTGIDEVLK